MNPWAIIGAFVASIALFAAGCWVGVDVEHARRVAEVNGINAQHATELAKAHQERADAEQHARDIEAQRAADMAALDAQHTKEMNDAKADADRTIADLRAGTLRLRERFTCPASTSTVPATAKAGTGTGLGDGATTNGLQREDAEFLVRESADATNEALKLKACQAIVRGDRGGAP